LKRKRYCYIFAIMIVVYFIFSRSLIVAEESIEESGWFADVFGRICSFIPVIGEKMRANAVNIVRKTAHVTEYAVLGGLLCALMNTFIGGIKTHIPWILFIGLFTACFDEGFQFYIEGRGSLVSDVFIDFGGILLSVIIAMIILYAGKRKKNS